MNLAAWLSKIENFPSGLNNRSLSNVYTIAAKLGLLSFAKFVITVAGTNGKGSCVAFLEAMFLAQGHTTGAYVSPHLLRYNERIRCNGHEVDDAILLQAFAQVEAARGAINLSFFEFTTLVALIIFKAQNPDVLILEVGLGGRFDAVNILTADLAIISSIALEHTQILGSTREAIGYEKAGIMRAGKPVIYGDSHPPQSIINYARQLSAELYAVDREFSYLIKRGRWDWQWRGKKYFDLPLPQLPIANAATVLMALQLLPKSLQISESAVVQGLKQAQLLGRWQQFLIAGKKVIFDVAHNPAAAALLANYLRQQPIQGKTFAVVSMLKDKDITATLLPFKELVAQWYVTELPGARAAPLQDLLQALNNIGITQVFTANSVSEALKQAIAECREIDRIVTFGSFHTVAEAWQTI